MKPLPLSVLVVALNEEKNLAHCLASLHSIAEEIVVVDSGSTDGTRATADRFGARWIHQDWLGMAGQKAFGLTQCRCPWVLILDADEEISEELFSEIQRFLERDDPSFDGAVFPRCTRFLGRWIRHGDWYPDAKLRLFRREEGRIAGSHGHDAVEVPGETVTLRGDLLHYSFPSLNAYVEKINHFSDRHLEDELAKGARWSLCANLFRPAWRFFRAYFLRRGFLDGFPGLWIAVATAFMGFVRHSRLYEHAHAQAQAHEHAPEEGSAG